MPEYLSPGVYIEEVDAGPQPIQGVGTSTTGFVGQTERGPTHPRLVTSWGSYQRWFGGLPANSQPPYLPYAVRGFFENGGQRLFIARVTGANAVPASVSIPAGPNNLVLTAHGPGTTGNNILILVSPSSDKVAGRFQLAVLYFRDPPKNGYTSTDLADPKQKGPALREDFYPLSVDPSDPNNVLKVVNASSQLIHATWGADTTANPPAAPAATAANALSRLTGGTDGVTPLVLGDFEGDDTLPSQQRTGLAGLASVKEIAILAAPDGPNIQGLREAVITQCELLRDRFAVVDADGNQGDVEQVNVVNDTEYGAVYFPWIRVYNERGDDTLLVPPSGHMCGIYARTDDDRGVFKAPANTVIQGMVTRDIGPTQKPLQYLITKGEQDILNPKGVNAIRDFRPDGRGIRVWGARTMSSDPDWKYINVRRLFIFIEESIDQGTQWAVFEPNDEKLWARIRQSISNFLTTQWRNGALMGTTRDEAFFVICDRTTMTEDDIDNGRLICEIGIAPVRPAEFVIFRIQQKTLDATTAAP
jgi:phage tail sheath protein FI